MKDDLIWKILKNIDKLINDEYGNFIIQQILKLKNDAYTKSIFDYICENLGQSSKQKYSSNVVDKCILYEDDNYRDLVINKMISEKLIPELIADQFGNYGIFYFIKHYYRKFITFLINVLIVNLVVQKALQMSSGLKFIEIIEMIKKVSKSLKYTNYGKKIYENLMKNYGMYLSNQNNHKNSLKVIKKNNSKIGLNNSINKSMNQNNISAIKNNNNANEFEESNKKQTKIDNLAKIHINKITNNNKNLDNFKSPNEHIGKIIDKNNKNSNNIIIKNEISVDGEKDKVIFLEKRNSDVNLIKNNSNSIHANQNNFSDLDKSFTQGRPRHGSHI